MKIANKDSAAHVTNRVTFKANHIYSENTNGCYVVYSYGPHFPIYVNKIGQWYGNEDKYSVSTSKHQSQARPDTFKGLSSIIYKTTEELKALYTGTIGSYRPLQ